MVATRQMISYVWWPARTVFDLIGPVLYQSRTTLSPTNITWIAFLCLDVACSLFLIALGHGAGRRGEESAPFWFWLGVVLLLIPIASRIIWPKTARNERLILLVVLAVSLFFYKNLYTPSNFAQFDELLHWVSATDILNRHKLFLENSLLPISPSFPALEILTTTLANLAGLQIFAAYMVVFSILRATFAVALFLFIEKITSMQIAAITVLVYMACPTFIVFDASFAYQSLGIVLIVLIMLAETQLRETQSARSLILPAMMFATLGFTHHLSAGFCLFYIGGLFAIQTLQHDEPIRARLLLGGLLGIFLLLVILPLLMVGHQLLGYLGPVIAHGISSFTSHSTAPAQAREAFVGENGEIQPLPYRVIGMLAVLFTACALAMGFFRSLCLSVPHRIDGWQRVLWIAQRKWGDSRVILLTLLAFGFPISVLLRLTQNGWEIGNRMSTFIFISVGLVVAVAIVHFWYPRVRHAMAIVAPIIWILLVGGVIISTYTHIRGPYVVGGDPSSIEAMGIRTSQWTLTWLGPGNRFVSDRVNRSLLASYGDQNVISSLGERIDSSILFFSDKITPETMYPIRVGNIDYLLTDLRLTTQRSVLGEYYENGDGANGPPPPENLLKFDNDKNTARIYDNGWIVIFDVSRLHG